MEKTHYLIIDDANSLTEEMLALMQASNSSITTVSTMLEAVYHLKSKPVQVILLNPSVPTPPGFTLESHLKSNYGQIKVIRLPAKAKTHEKPQIGYDRKTQDSYRKHIRTVDRRLNVDKAVAKRRADLSRGLTYNKPVETRVKAPHLTYAEIIKKIKDSLELILMSSNHGEKRFNWAMAWNRVEHYRLKNFTLWDMKRLMKEVACGE